MLEAEQGQVHIYLYALSQLQAQYGDKAYDLLSSAEQQALRSVRAEQRYRECLYGRAALRTLLAAHSGLAPAEIRILRKVRDKPYIEDGPSFNLSHAGDHLAIAIAAYGEFGIDIEEEHSQSVADMQSIAQRHFSQAEQAILAQSKNLPQAFFRIWTLKEAALKALGQGLYLPMQRLHLQNIEEELYQIELAEETEAISLQARYWSLPQSRSLALASVGALPQVICHF